MNSPFQTLSERSPTWMTDCPLRWINRKYVEYDEWNPLGETGKLDLNPFFWHFDAECILLTAKLQSRPALGKAVLLVEYSGWPWRCKFRGWPLNLMFRTTASPVRFYSNNRDEYSMLDFFSEEKSNLTESKTQVYYHLCSCRFLCWSAYLPWHAHTQMNIGVHLSQKSWTEPPLRGSS